MTPSCSRFNPRATHKRYATLEWHVPALDFTLAWPTKGMVWYGPSPHPAQKVWVAHKKDMVWYGTFLL